MVEQRTYDLSKAERQKGMDSWGSPSWAPKRLLKALDLIDLETYVLSRHQLSAGHGVHAFDLNQSLYIDNNKDANELRIRLKQIEGITLSGHPVVLQNEHVETFISTGSSELTHFDLWVHVNPVITEASIQDSVKKIILDASGKIKKSDASLDLGGFEFDASTNELTLMRRPQVTI